MKEGRLIVISGPSGTGKGTIIHRVLDRLADTEFSVSMTTRPMRAGEEDGKDYLFVSREDFENTIAQGGFLEWAEVYGNYYGTPRAQMEDRLRTGKDVILDIDVQGAENVKNAMPEAVLIFILPPSMEELRRRITGRAKDAPEVIEDRLTAALSEIRRASMYDYAIINDDLEEATEKAVAIVRAIRCEVDPAIQDTIQRYEEET